MTDFETSSYILDIELELEHLRALKSNLERKISDKDQQIGKLNSQRIKAEALKKDLEDQLRHFEENSLGKELFTEKISGLISYLQKQRKTSQDEDSRNLLEEYVVLLKKVYDDN